MLTSLTNDNIFLFLIDHMIKIVQDKRYDAKRVKNLKVKLIYRL
jgi:hypothetical protein